MGRPSKLDDRQWAEIGRRLAAGETAADLAKEFRVGRTTIVGRFSDRVTEIRSAAQALASAELMVEKMPVSDAMSVRSLADQLKGLSNSIAEVASTSAETSKILSLLAHRKAKTLLTEPETNPDDLKIVAALQETANRAITTGMGLLQANKGQAAAEENGSVTVVTGVPR